MQNWFLRNRENLSLATSLILSYLKAVLHQPAPIIIVTDLNIMIHGRNDSHWIVKLGNDKKCHKA